MTRTHKFKVGDRVRVKGLISNDSLTLNGSVGRVAEAHNLAGGVPYYVISCNNVRYQGGIWEDELTLVMAADALVEDQVTDEEIAAFKAAWNAAGPGGRVRAGLAAVKSLSL